MALLQHSTAPTDGSRTVTLLESQSKEEESQTDTGGESSTIGSLRLRGAHRHRQRVVWREDVVDNETAGKKKTKICCIYHRPKRFDESSSSDSSGSDSDSGSDSSCDRNRNDDHDRPRRRRPDHPAPAANGQGAATRNGQGGGVVHELEGESDDVNSYERMPRRKPKKGKMVTHNDA
ncbi:Type 1 phosphatases regulator YPI1 [Grifola frondosa]|uniref:Type 1 phosphatases regulator n=1 Tax=Grifola frondosa TaxID=5627 RepID=A0A1C7LNE4_GRIFR|nr:Type 1 phosphatases regulator YPI1 [Grifola frondosa]